MGWWTGTGIIIVGTSPSKFSKACGRRSSARIDGRRQVCITIFSLVRNFDFLTCAMAVGYSQALQPGLVKGRWSKEEDNIITASVSSGNDKWSEIAKRLPGRIGEQIKERWINVLDPDVKKGIWTEAEMKILRDSQMELGNKWSKIAKWGINPSECGIHPMDNQYN